MESINLKSSNKQIAINNEDGELVTVLKIDVEDSKTVERFSNLISNLYHVSNEFEKEVEELNEKYKDSKLSEDNIDTEQVIDRSKLNIKVLERYIQEIDIVFGDCTIRNVFAANYQLHEDFIPSEYLLVEFIDSVTPVMESLFQTRFEEKKKKYSVAKRGKHNLSKEDLIKQAMGN